MRKRDGKESDRDGGKIACEILGDVWIRFGRIPRAGYSHARCPQLSGASVVSLYLGSDTRAHCLAIRVSRYPQKCCDDLHFDTSGFTP